MLLAKKYYEKEKFEEAWYDSSMIYYSKMEEDANENKGDLTIVFKNGSAYKYKGVSFGDYVLLIGGGTDASNGKTLNKIIKGQYQYEKLGSANMEELNERYETILEEKNRIKRTYFISGPCDITEKEFEINYMSDLDGVASMDSYFIVGDGDGTDIMAQNYMISVLGINPNRITVFCRGDKPKNINKDITRIVSGFETENDMDIEMSKSSAYDIAYTRKEQNSSRVAQNILRRHTLIEL